MEAKSVSSKWGTLCIEKATDRNGQRALEALYSRDALRQRSAKLLLCASVRAMGNYAETVIPL